MIIAFEYMLFVMWLTILFGLKYNLKAFYSNLCQTLYACVKQSLLYDMVIFIMLMIMKKNFYRDIMEEKSNLFIKTEYNVSPVSLLSFSVLSLGNITSK